jgi:hypothetical protein
LIDVQQCKWNLDKHQSSNKFIHNTLEWKDLSSELSLSHSVIITQLLLAMFSGTDGVLPVLSHPAKEGVYMPSLRMGMLEPKFRRSLLVPTRKGDFEGEADGGKTAKEGCS